jgi:hypothetical protein
VAIATVGAEIAQPKPEPRADPDAALRAAIKVAVDAGDVSRAGALLELMKPMNPGATVIALGARRRGA